MEAGLLPTLTQVEYIIAVADHRHFGKAAKACHISQPTLSQQIQKAEELLGVVLFDRVQKPVKLTPEGQRFLEQARTVLREYRRLLELARAVTGELAGTFRLGIIPTVAASLVPLFVQRFAAKYASAELYIEEMQTESILRDLREDRIDAAVMATPLPAHTLHEDPLYYEPFHLYASPGHPILRKKALGPQDLDGAELWLLQDGHCFRDQVIRFCSIAPETPPVLKNVHFQSGSLDTLRSLVKQGHGYTLIPAMMASFLGKEERKAHVRSFATPTPAREISLVYRRDHWKVTLAKALRQTILESLPPEVSKQKKPTLHVLELC